MWRLFRDGDPAGLALFERHYSARQYKDGRTRRLFMGPGEKMVLLTPDKDALLARRRCKYPSLDGQSGACCSVFRNESRHRSSDLIRAAMPDAWPRWPGERLYTYVNAAKVRSMNPVCCFKSAGWRRCGVTKGGLIVLEMLPPFR